MRLLFFRDFITFNVFIIFCVLISHAFAQGRIPDFSASELQLQQQRERELREQMESIPNVQLDTREQQEQPNVRLPQTEEPCFDIQTLQLTGELSDRFQWALRAANKDAQGKDDIATNRCLSSQGINIVMGRIQNAIIQRGYVTTRVVAPEQDLASGTLSLVVIPGYVHQIRWADEMSGKTASWRTALPMREGDLLNLRDLEQGLEMLKRVPTAEADIQIEPGDDPGQSDLVITRSQRFPFRLNVSIDDGGSKSTGRYQGGLTFSYDNWLNLNDLFYISLNHDIGDANGGGSRGHTIHYSVPFRGNWLFSVNGSYYHYDQLIQGINQQYKYSGNSRNFDMSVSRRLFRTSTIRTNVYFKGWTRNSHNYIEDTEIEVQRRRTSGWEIGADYRQYLGNSILNAGLSYRRGTGANRAIRAPEEAYGGGTSRMEIINLNATLSAPVQIANQSFRYFGTLRSQWNGTPLTSQDQFSIGGRYTVRGFDGRVNLMGDRGWLIRNDFGWIVPNTNHELYLGVDYGEVSGPATQYQVGRSLSGAVIGLRGSIATTQYGYFSYDVFTGTWLKKPSGFEASKYVAGFNLNLAF
ncbi:Hemolysin transporter protein ShlB [Saezia sanguinis]|uniref:Hemolysin transporter protein ShlB n=1 Tax=Saezia sanguinis TaxID=1965230 RepID=A0A433SG63_9BURK|nr:Hemolysin transporter protein ShlB [Saezia sanguinis]